MAQADRKLALVTGASAGLGAAFARKAARSGLDVVLVARRADRLVALAAELEATGVSAAVVAADLSDPASPARILAAVAGLDRSVDVLINNAGTSLPPSYANTTWADQEKFIQLSVTSPAHLIHAVLPGMLLRGWGRIVNVSSATAFSAGGAGHTLYPAVKSFLVKASQSLAAEVKAKGVHVSALVPVFVATEFLDANGMAEKMASAPRSSFQTPEAVVEECWRRNDAGAEVIVPGFKNKIAIAALRYIPEGLTRGLIRRAAEKYRVDT